MKDMLDFLIGQQLKAKRISKGYSLEEVGKVLKTSKVTIYNYEEGIYSIRYKALMDLCGFLGLDYIEVLENARKEYYGHNEV